MARGFFDTRESYPERFSEGKEVFYPIFINCDIVWAWTEAEKFCLPFSAPTGVLRKARSLPGKSSYAASESSPWFHEGPGCLWPRGKSARYGVFFIYRSHPDLVLSSSLSFLAILVFGFWFIVQSKVHSPGGTGAREIPLLLFLSFFLFSPAG